MKKLLMLVLICAGLASQHASAAPEALVESVLTKQLADIPGKEGLLLVVSYPPGASDVVHRHNAHGFIYVLEGTVVMQVQGGPQVTLRAGQTYYEGPADLHVVGRNDSITLPAKFVVFLVKDAGAPFFLPVE